MLLGHLRDLGGLSVVVFRRYDSGRLDKKITDTKAVILLHSSGHEGLTNENWARRPIQMDP